MSQPNALQLFLAHAFILKNNPDQEKKPYIEKAAELKAQAENGEGSGVSPSSLLSLSPPSLDVCRVFLPATPSIQDRTEQLLNKQCLASSDSVVDL